MFGPVLYITKSKEELCNWALQQKVAYLQNILNHAYNRIFKVSGIN